MTPRTRVTPRDPQRDPLTNTSRTVTNHEAMRSRHPHGRSRAALSLTAPLIKGGREESVRVGVRAYEPEQLNLLQDHDELEQGFDGWDIFNHPAQDTQPAVASASAAETGITGNAARQGSA